MATAVEIFIRYAYPAGSGCDGWGGSLERFRPPEGVELFEWLMGDQAERNPPDAAAAEIRRFALRMGNSLYPNMKLTLARHGESREWIFAVDSHDLMLHAREDRPDEARALEQLKEHNRQVARAIHQAWEAAGLLTEHAFLRRQIATRQQELRDGKA